MSELNLFGSDEEEAQAMNLSGDLNALLPITEATPDTPFLNETFPEPRTAAPLTPEGDLGFPSTLPIEVALGTAPIPDLLKAYKINPMDWEAISSSALFQRTVDRARNYIAKNENAAFKLKARIQAEALLDTSYLMIHDESTPAAVRADLIKQTMKWGDYTDTNEKPSAAGAGFQININFGGSASPRPTIDSEAVTING